MIRGLNELVSGNISDSQYITYMTSKYEGRAESGRVASLSSESRITLLRQIYISKGWKKEKRAGKEAVARVVGATSEGVCFAWPPLCFLAFQEGR